MAETIVYIKYKRRFFLKKNLHIYYFLLIFCLSSKIIFAQEAAFEIGTWYKIPISENGVYKIDQKYLRKNKISTSIKLDEIRIYTGASKELKQANNNHTFGYLKEIPVQISDKNGKLDKNDYLLFYAENADEVFYDSLNGFSHNAHHYDKANYVFLQINNGKSRQLSTLSDNNTNAKPLDNLAFYEYYEPAFVSLITSGREWFGDYFSSKFNKKIAINGLATDLPISLKIKLISNSYQPTKAAVTSNNSPLGQMTLPRIFYQRNDRILRYSRAGEIVEQNFQYLPTEENQNLELSIADNASVVGAYVDQISWSGALKLNSNQKHKYILPQNYPQQLALANTTTWIIENPYTYYQLKPNNEGVYQIDAHKQLRKIVNTQTTLAPDIAQKISTINLQNTATPTLLIVSSEKLRSEAERLAEFRRQNDKLTVEVVSIEDIYNNFSGGKKDPTAIRDFCKILYNKNTQKFKYLLLLGDASFDTKDNSGINFIDKSVLLPTYQSKESLEPIYSYASDDYFGFLETHEGDWNEGTPQNGFWQSNQENDHTLELGIGRLPAKNLLEAKEMIDKIIRYETQNYEEAFWQSTISFTADDDDGNIHQNDGEVFSNKVQKLRPDLKINKIYVDAFPQINTEEGIKAPAATAALEQAIELGSLIINFNGHGAPSGWTDEKLLTTAEIINWNNKNKLPIFFTATCEFGRFDDPYTVSGAELSMLNANGGAIALLTTGRPVFSSTNFRINEAFYDALLKNDAADIRLGDIFKITKNNALQGEINRNFSLLGDPSLKIKLANNSLNNSVKNLSRNDGTFQPLDKIKISGETKNLKEGTLFIEAHFPDTLTTTFGGARYPSMQFYEQGQKFFKGQTIVENGKFDFEMVIPVIDLPYDSTIKIYFHTTKNDSWERESGHILLKISNLDSVNKQNDVTGPSILFLGENDGQLHFEISDTTGLSLGIQNEQETLQMTVNDTLHLNLAENFIFYEDNTQGKASVYLADLPKGIKTIKIEALDLQNNKSMASFDLSDSIQTEAFAIDTKAVYPNPTANLVTFGITHNKPGSDLMIKTSIMDGQGKTIFSQTNECKKCEKEIAFGMNLEQIIKGSAIVYYQLEVINKVANQNVQTAGKLMVWK